MSTELNLFTKELEVFDNSFDLFTFFCRRLNIERGIVTVATMLTKIYSRQSRTSFIILISLYNDVRLCAGENHKYPELFTKYFLWIRRALVVLASKENSTYLRCQRIGIPNTSKGLAFLIHPKIKDCVTDFKTYSNRVIKMQINLKGKDSVTVINAYAPTSSEEDEKVEQFYDDIEREMADI